MSPLINRQEVDTELDVVGTSIEVIAGSEVESVVFLQLEQLGWGGEPSFASSSLLLLLL